MTVCILLKPCNSPKSSVSDQAKKAKHCLQNLVEIQNLNFNFHFLVLKEGQKHQNRHNGMDTDGYLKLVPFIT